MQKVSINPQPMSVEHAARLFEALDDTGREKFYRSLSDNDRDALYERVTQALIARVPLTTKNRIDAQRNKERNAQRGYILPDECHRAENDCLWRSAAWYVLLGQVSASLRSNLPHMRAHFDTLQEAEKNEAKTEAAARF
ncbi:hypothetical protein F4Z98_05930 [Candidatus Poribacteria bacterium]|nr:hypothetical protein [Candidatus Poribacteria bacterium]MYB01782.1 hypothetical protein [Candidatus Poribacteria bacterium]MYI37341.1 hypothetical protein [Acidimicrobiaceae bacterium]